MPNVPVLIPQSTSLSLTGPGSPPPQPSPSITTQPSVTGGLPTRTSQASAPRSNLLDQIEIAADRANQASATARDASIWTAVEVAIRDAKKVADTDYCEDIRDRELWFRKSDWDRIHGQLRTAFGRPEDSPVTDCLGDMMRFVPGLNTDAQSRERPKEVIYFVRAVLEGVDAAYKAPDPQRARDSLNRLAVKTLEVLPLLTPSPVASIAMMALPMATLGQAQFPRDTVAAAARTLTMDPKTRNRAINLVLETMDKLPRGGLSDELAQRITQILVASPGGRGKHLGRLHDQFIEKAGQEQLNTHRPQLRQAGWA